MGGVPRVRHDSREPGHFERVEGHDRARSEKVRQLAQRQVVARSAELWIEQLDGLELEPPFEQGAQNLAVRQQ